MKKELKTKEDILERIKVLETERNAVEKYMGPDEHDEALEEEWEKINNELAELKEKLKECS